MRQRLGLAVTADDEGLDLATQGAQLGLLHFDACLAGVSAPRPTALLRSLAGAPEFDSDALNEAEAAASAHLAGHT